MPKIYLIAILLFISGGVLSCKDNGKQTAAYVDSTAPTPRPDYNIIEKHMTLAERNLRGKVKSITRIHYVFSDSSQQQSDKNLFSKEQEFYDTLGRNIETDRYLNINGKTTKTRMIARYDAKGNLLDMQETKENGEVAHKTNIVYNAKGNEIEEDSQSPDSNFNDKTVLKYNDSNYITELDIYKPNGKLDKKVNFRYTDNGKMKETVTDKGDKSVSRYDEKGNHLQTTSFDASGRLKDDYVTLYNEQGKMTSEVHKGANGNIEWKRVYKYDDKGNLTELDYYDKNGILDTRESYAKEYVYDTAGNIIKETSFMMRSGKKIPKEVAEAQIEYYSR